MVHQSPEETKTPDWYMQEFQKLAKQVWDAHHVDYDEHDTLLYSMDSIHHELVEVGGFNWNDGDYSECLQNVKEILLAYAGFSDEQVTEIRRCVAALRKRDRILRHSEIDYLVSRTVDWCYANPKPSEEV